MTCAVTLLVLAVCVPSGTVQATNADRELSRLQTQAEDSMAQGDSQGAANTIGRAALLASQLSKHKVPDTTQPPYHLIVDLFRTQEQVYRAMALFQQSGERTLSRPESARYSPWASNMPPGHWRTIPLQQRGRFWMNPFAGKPRNGWRSFRNCNRNGIAGIRRFCYIDQTVIINDFLKDLPGRDFE